MYKPVVISLVLAAAAMGLPQPQRPADLDSTVAEIFGSKPSTETTAASVTTSAPQPQQPNQDIDSIIADIFGPKPSTGAPSPDIDSLLEEIFGPKNATSTNSGSVIDIDGEAPSIFLTSTASNKNQTSTESPTRKDGDTGEACTVMGKRGMCARYYECEREAGQPDGLIDIAGGGGTDIPCVNYLDVCCVVVNRNKKFE